MSKSYPKTFSLLPQPEFAWLAIIGFILILAVLIGVRANVLVILFCPLAAFAVGILLYFRAPLLYVGFTWWLWFLIPFVRRLSDWRSNTFIQPSPLLMTPYLVTLISIITLWKCFPKVHRQGGLPFLLSFLAVIYGITVGLIYRQPLTLIINGLDWIVPVVFGFHLFANWRSYPTYRQNFQRVFLWGVLIMGIYGIIQFCFSPPWDAYWLAKADFGSGTIGGTQNLKPFSINVWSTMTSNRPFSTVMMAGLILLFVNKSKGKLGLPASIAGYISFLLARKRTTWASWLIAFFILLTSLKSHIQKRIIISIVIGAIFLVPLSSVEPFSSFIYSRFESFSTLEDDHSANARLETFEKLSDQAFLSFFGQGIGGRAFDSGILSTLLDLGWFGAIFYIGGIILLLLSLFQKNRKTFDSFMYAARAISLSIFMQLPLGRPHIEAQGMILWGFLSMAIAGQQYYLQLNRKYSQNSS